MPDTRTEIDEAAGPVRRLLEKGEDGLGRTKTHALRRAVVREALVERLHDNLGREGFDGDAWLRIEEAPHEHGPLESDRLTEIVGPPLAVDGWRDAHGALLAGWAPSGALQPVLWRAEGYGLLRNAAASVRGTRRRIA